MSLLHRERGIMSVVEGAENLSTLTRVLRLTRLEGELSGGRPYTFFAPTNDAFERISPKTMDELIDDKKRLTEVLRYHIMEGRFTTMDALSRKSGRTLEGSFLYFDNDDGKLVVNGSPVIGQDIDCRNGIIHVIDRVLLPYEKDHSLDRSGP